MYAMENDYSESMFNTLSSGKNDHPVLCDIFCNVIDNYGDIGVSWRLARQLAYEFGLVVRLWVDDLGSFAKLCPEADAALAQQSCRGVEVRRWEAIFPEVRPAELVIEAFGCVLPQTYLAEMAGGSLSGSIWNIFLPRTGSQGCHKLPSPHPRFR